MALRGLLALAAGGAAALMQGDLGDRNQVRRRSDFRYTPDPKIVRLAAGAHRSSAADLLWLRTLPDMSKEFDDPAVKARWIAAALEAVTDLDPHFGTVYDFGQAYLTVIGRSDPGAVDKAIALLEKGHRKNPESAGMLIRLAMIHWIERKDRDEALRCLRLAAPLPDMDQLSMQMLATLESRGRDDMVALGRWIPLIESGTEEMKLRAELSLYAIKMEIARRAVREFTAKHGRAPAEPREIADPGLIQADAIPLVMDGLRFLEGAQPSYDRAVELNYRDLMVAYGRSARQFHAEAGRWPTLDELTDGQKSLAKAPAGKRWRLEKDRLELVAEDENLPPEYK